MQDQISSLHKFFISALKLPNGKIYSGRSHAKAYNAMLADNLNYPESCSHIIQSNYEAELQGKVVTQGAIDGFTDQDGVFYTRLDANEIIKRQSS
jgi:hypothetical protein